jgi:hypothetical protein
MTIPENMRLAFFLLCLLIMRKTFSVDHPKTGDGGEILAQRPIGGAGRPIGQNLGALLVLYGSLSVMLCYHILSIIRSRFSNASSLLKSNRFKVCNIHYDKTF